MELTAATIATRLNKKLIDELKCRIDKVYFWTDSTTVLRYISNDATRFKTFVANRVSVIREATSVDQWNYISSKENPSDVASRGCSVKTLMNDNNWFKGPSFLQDDQSTWPSGKIPNNLDQDEISDSEIKRVVTVTVERESPIDKLVKHYSNWKCLVRAVALLRQCVRWCRNKLTSFTLTVENLEEAKSCIVKHEQLKFLGEIVEVCEQNNQEHKAKLLRSINVSKLDPYVANGVLRIGGRLRRADIYIKRRWRQVQYLTDIFWKRWIHEYLPCLQERQKWLYPKRNVEIGDIVLVIDSNIRNSWALARVISVITDKGGLSRIATVKTKSGILQRPISKLCLVLECDEKL
ncbi:uncharacterized protein LOC126811404 [Patella vulgata]|uniref:uncharacterized protein LOC126811404 n=1 Tax=Patella vulgata TaxID=6465 RepID=UPI0024A9AB81|nr:uncharacterized protein LOC126811404 [Patella vulgata]